MPNKRPKKNEACAPPTSRYIIRLTARMVLALVDIDCGEAGVERRWNGLTADALLRRGLVVPNAADAGFHLTRKGRDYLSACAAEYETAERFLDATIAASKGKK